MLGLETVRVLFIVFRMVADGISFCYQFIFPGVPGKAKGT